MATLNESDVSRNTSTDSSNTTGNMVDTIFSSFIARKMKEIERSQVLTDQTMKTNAKKEISQVLNLTHHTCLRKTAEEEKTSRESDVTSTKDRAASTHTDVYLPKRDSYQDTQKKAGNDFKKTEMSIVPTSISDHSKHKKKRKRKDKHKDKHKSRHHSKHKHAEAKVQKHKTHRHESNGNGFKAEEQVKTQEANKITFENMHDLELEEHLHDINPAADERTDEEESPIDDDVAHQSKDTFWTGVELLPDNDDFSEKTHFNVRTNLNSCSKPEKPSLQKTGVDSVGLFSEVGEVSCSLQKLSSIQVPNLPLTEGMHTDLTFSTNLCYFQPNSSSASHQLYTEGTLAKNSEDYSANDKTVVPVKNIASEKPKPKIVIKDIKLSSVVLSSTAPVKKNLKEDSERSSDTDEINELDGDTDGEIFDSDSDHPADTVNTTRDRKKKHIKKHKHKSKKKKKYKHKHYCSDSKECTSSCHKQADGSRAHSNPPRSRRHSRSHSRSRCSLGKRKLSYEESGCESKYKSLDYSNRSHFTEERYRCRPHYIPRSRSRSPIKDARERIDKVRLLRVAKQNLLQLQKTGALPAGLTLPDLKPEQMAMIHAGGKTVEELTGK